MNSDSPISNIERAEAVVWLRDVLTAMLEICPLSYQQKRKTARFLSRMPDWLMASWAESCNIDYVSGYSRYPDMAEKVRSDIGRNLVQRYVENHDAVPVANTLDDLVKTVVKQTREGDLPANPEMITRQVCALAWADCTAEGTGIAESASGILSDPEQANHLLIGYKLALEYGNKEKLEALDAVLTGGRYGEWVTSRIEEGKRYLGLDYPTFRIHFGERTPQWDALWGNIIKGGNDD